MAKTTRKTVKKSNVSRREQAEQTADALKARIANFNFSRSYTSLAYGVITVIVLFALVFAGFRVFTQNNTPEISQDAVNTADQTDENMYVVQDGETLWSISEKVYNDGFRWKEIADANKLTDPNNLEAGTKLNIPEKESFAQESNPTAEVTAVPTLEAVTPTVAQQQAQPTQATISGTQYTVHAGDTLWDISMRVYGTGYRWSEIATANALANPDLIFTGTTLKLPAK
jgi:nucleoid-associated protein YgaU